MVWEGNGSWVGGRETYAPLTKKHILQLAADEEGHCDNIAAAVYVDNAAIAGSQRDPVKRAAEAAHRWKAGRCLSIRMGRHRKFRNA